MNQLILDLTDPTDVAKYIEPDDVSIKDNVFSMLRLGLPLLNLCKESEGEFRSKILGAVIESYKTKFNTNLLYIEDLGEDVKEGRFTSFHPYYTLCPLKVEDWFNLVKEYVEMNCKDILHFDSQSEGTTYYGSKYGSILYEFNAIPGCGLVLTHYNSEGSTSVRLYIKDDNVVFYMPSKVFNKSSGRYNKVTGHNYVESIKMMILSFNSINVDDLIGTVTLLKDSINVRRSKEVSVEEIMTLMKSCREESPEYLNEYCTEMFAELPDNMNDMLWRLTKFDKTLGDVLDSFKKTIVSMDARLYLGQLAYDVLVCDRLCKEV